MNTMTSSTSTSGLVQFDDNIALRGCKFDLAAIKGIYKEFKRLTETEANRIVDQFTKPRRRKQSEFDAFKQTTKESAFRVTITIVGHDGAVHHGDSEQLFDSKDLPHPIKLIYFTNITAHRHMANGEMPPNHFQVWINFEKPALLDPSVFVSAPTPNASRVEIHGEELSYFRAAQSIAKTAFEKNRTSYEFLHRKFVYDLGLCFVALPYSLYMVTSLLDKIELNDGPWKSFELPLFLYGIGISLVLYRILTSYLKWAFPVNVLAENKDRAMRHRVMIGGIFLALIVSMATSFLSQLSGIVSQ